MVVFEPCVDAAIIKVGGAQICGAIIFVSSNTVCINR